MRVASEARMLSSFRAMLLSLLEGVADADAALIDAAADMQRRTLLHALRCVEALALPLDNREEGGSGGANGQKRKRSEGGAPAADGTYAA